MMLVRNLSIGDRLPASAGPAPLFRPGPARWYALRVAPQREAQAEAWLALRGVYGFHPVLIRKVPSRGAVREYQRRYLPGYVFARFRGEPVVHRVLACNYITGALSRQDGIWGILEPAKLAAIHSMRALDAAAIEARKADAIRRRQQMAIRPGDRALFKGGVFGGMTCEVVELQAGGGAVVRLEMYGREVLLAGAGEMNDLVPLRTVALDGKPRVGVGSAE